MTSNDELMAAARRLGQRLHHQAVRGENRGAADDADVC